MTMKKVMSTLAGPWGILSAFAMLLVFSKRARMVTSKTIKKGYKTAAHFSTSSKGHDSTKVAEKNKSEQENYPSYIGYGKSKSLSSNQKVRKINPTRYQNTKNVLSDKKMPSKMAEIAEEFDLKDKPQT